MNWWRNGTFYALFPLSFNDSNGDGFGDIEGIEQRLDYLQWLAVDAVWLGPIFPSPMVDAGYDVAGYTGVHPLFGSLESFDRLIAACHARGLKLILDFVPNHTSDQHPWFIQSRSSRTNGKHDWYVWHDGKPDRSPPNNWIDNFGDSAWTWDEYRGQFYYRLFLPTQPELNLRNPDVVAALSDAMRFWLRRGVDGFRVDAVMNLIEDHLLRDEPMSKSITGGPPGWMDHVFTSDRAETHRVLAHFRRVIDEFDDRLFVGEVIAPIDRVMRFYGAGEPEVHLPFNNQLMKTEPWSARFIDASIDQYMLLLPNDAAPNWVLGSHDVTRTATRLGQAQARVAAMMLLTLPGAAFLYYGDELGLEDVRVHSHEARDAYHRLGLGRDPYRAPMPWNSSDTAGFTSGKPWLPLPKDHRTRNVEALQADERSILHLHRRLIALRKELPALREQGWQACRGEGETVVYRRLHTEGNALVALNLGGHTERITLEHSGRILLSTHLDREGEATGELELRANEGVVVALATSGGI